MSTASRTSTAWSRWAVTAAASLLACTAALADVFPTPPLPGPPRPLGIDTPAEQRLPNGLRVVVAQRRGVQLVTARLVVLSGSEVDPPERSGLASMTAALLTKGTSRHTASTLAQAAESLGGALDSSAGWHESGVSITVSVPQLDRALSLVSETIQHPRFAQDELDRLRTQTLDELKVAYTQPGTLASIAAQHVAFGGGIYGRPASGTPTSLPRIGRSDLLALHRAIYRPDNAVLVFSGDLDVDTAWRLARKHFGTWRTVAHPAALPAATLSTSNSEPSTTVIDMPASGQAAVALILPMPPLAADRAVGAVTNAVLGGGYSSRLSQEIRVQRGLSYSAGSQIESRRSAGILRVMVQTKNESAAEVVKLVQGELDRLVSEPVGADELAARKATLVGEISRSVETTAGLGATVVGLVVDGRPLSALSTRLDAVGAVTSEDLQRFATARFAPARRLVVIAGDHSHFAHALEELAPNVPVVPLSEFSVERADGLTSH